jgi:hypothetical protein
MSWCFETDADYQEQLDWVEKFVRGEVEPIDHRYSSRCATVGYGPATSNPNWAGKGTVS